MGLFLAIIFNPYTFLSNDIFFSSLTKGMSDKPNVIDVENFKSVRVAQDDPLVVDVSEATDNTIVYRFESDKPFSHGTAVLSQDDAAVTVTEATQSGGKYMWSNKSKLTANSKLIIKSSEAEGIIVNGKAIIYEGKDPLDTIPLLDKVEFPTPVVQQPPSYLMIAVGVALLAFFLYIIIRLFNN